MFKEDFANGETPSFEGFAKFLETKDPAERYEWADSTRCACAQYWDKLGKTHSDWLIDKTMRELNRVAAGGTVGDNSFAVQRDKWTFGDCLERMKKSMEPA